MNKKSFIIFKGSPKPRCPFSLVSDKDCFIVTGAQGFLGQTYLRFLSGKIPASQLIGLHRRPLTGKEIKGVNYQIVDLCQKESVENLLSKLNLNQKSKITVVHTVGMFRYEPNGKPHEKYDCNKDGIDDDIYNSNVITTQNIIGILLKTYKGAQISAIAFSSIIKYHNFPHFSSYDKAKNIMEDYLKNQTKEHKNLSVIVFNIPTLNTKAERTIRPFAERADTWLSPKLLVQFSFPEILLSEKNNHKEIDVYTPYKEFDLQRFINDHAERWLRETGLSGN